MKMTARFPEQPKARPNVILNVTNANSREGAKVTHPTRLTVPDVTDTLLEEMVSKKGETLPSGYNNPLRLTGMGGADQRESDLDILVVMDVDGSPIRKAADISRIARPRLLPMDIIMRTPDEIEHRIEIGDPFIRKIVNQGKVLYE